MGAGGTFSKSIIHGVTHLMLRGAGLAALLASSMSVVTAQRGAAPAARPAATGIDAARLEMIPAIVEQAIDDKKLPGAVVLVGRGDRVIYQKAIGRRAVEPAPEPMT